MDQESPTDRQLVDGAAADPLAKKRQAYLLRQLLKEDGAAKSNGDLNKKLSAAARRELKFDPKTANAARHDLAEGGFLEERKVGRTIAYTLTETGRTYLTELGPLDLDATAKSTLRVDESTISDEVREAQKAFLLLQLLDAEDRRLSRGEANRIRDGLRHALGLKPAVANYRREKLAEQGYVRITRSGRNESYTLTADGLDYLAANDRHLTHAAFTIRGSTLNALIAAAKESGFGRPEATQPVPTERPLPSSSELADAVLAEFEDLRRERHSRSGLVPIHEVRQRIVDQFGPASGRHDVLDEVILGLWRQKRLGLEAISILADATEEQLLGGIKGTHGILFYLEAPSEQPVAP